MSCAALCVYAVLPSSSFSIVDNSSLPPTLSLFLSLLFWFLNVFILADLFRSFLPSFHCSSLSSLVVVRAPRQISFPAPLLLFFFFFSHFESTILLLKWKILFNDDTSRHLLLLRIDCNIESTVTVYYYYFKFVVTLRLPRTLLFLVIVVSPPPHHHSILFAYHESRRYFYSPRRLFLMSRSGIVESLLARARILIAHRVVVVCTFGRLSPCQILFICRCVRSYVHPIILSVLFYIK